MSFKINENHWIVLIEFMEKHQSFARGQFSGPSGKVTQRKLWEELSLKLNSLGYGSKTTEKWQKTWADIKYIIKKKSATFKKEFGKTGGGVGFEVKLNPYEERIVAILGKSFAEGVGSVECGIISENKPTSSGTSSSTQFELLAGPSSLAKATVDFEMIDFESVEDESDQQQAEVTISSKKSRQLSSDTDGQKKNVTAEHSYCGAPKVPRKRKQEDLDNELYETIDELRLIRTGVSDIAKNLLLINETLKEIKNAILQNQNP